MNRRLEVATLEINALKISFKARNTENTALREKLEHLKSTGEATVATLNQRLEVATLEKDALKNSFKNHNTKNTALQEKIEHLKSTGEATVATLNQRLEVATLEKDALKNSFKNHNTKNTALQEKIEHLKSTDETTVATLNQRLQFAAREKDALKISFKNQDMALREKFEHLMGRTSFRPFSFRGSCVVEAMSPQALANIHQLSATDPILLLISTCLLAPANPLPYNVLPPAHHQIQTIETVIISKYNRLKFKRSRKKSEHVLNALPSSWTLIEPTLFSS